MGGSSPLCLCVLCELFIAASTFIHLYRNRRFFDLAKDVGVQIRTTGAHLHAETAVELAYILPVSSQIKSSESQYYRPEITGQLKTGQNNGFFEF